MMDDKDDPTIPVKNEIKSSKNPHFSLFLGILEDATIYDIVYFAHNRSLCASNIFLMG